MKALKSTSAINARRRGETLTHSLGPAAEMIRGGRIDLRNLEEALF